MSEQPAQSSGRSALDDARHDFAMAEKLTDDAHGRMQYALSAADSAAEAVFERGASAEDVAAAREVLAKARSITTRDRSAVAARRFGRTSTAERSHGVEID